MSNNAILDRTLIDSKFDVLCSRLQNEIMMKALGEGGKALKEYTQQSLLQKFPKASTAKGQGKKPMIEDVHIVTDKGTQEVIVSVMNYLTKWYEMGTGERYTKEDHPKDATHHRTYKKDERRGRITPLHYFQAAREAHNDDVIKIICDVVLEELQKDFND